MGCTRAAPIVPGLPEGVELIGISQAVVPVTIVSNAPAEVVDKERARLDAETTRRTNLSAALEALS